jgi:hypothetical protein
LFEAPAEGFFWNLPEFGRRIQFDVLHGCETRPLEAYFKSREEPKVTRSEIRRLWWLGYDGNDFFGEELLHNKRFVARCKCYREADTIKDLWLGANVIVMQTQQNICGSVQMLS